MLLRLCKRDQEAWLRLDCHVAAPRGCTPTKLLRAVPLSQMISCLTSL
jgi:hypothetical protein